MAFDGSKSKTQFFSSRKCVICCCNKIRIPVENVQGYFAKEIHIRISVHTVIQK